MISCAARTLKCLDLHPVTQTLKQIPRGRDCNRYHLIEKDGDCTSKLNAAHWVQEKPYFCNVCFFRKISCMPGLKVLLDSVVKV